MKKLNYDFKKPELLELALTQSGANARANNERLEFLGDRVLGLAVADLLYNMYPGETEGELARRQAALISAKTLAPIATGLGLKIKHGHMTGGKMENVLADAVESVIAAVFLDGGWAAAKKFVDGIWNEIAAADSAAPKDPKTKLQEMAQHSGDGKLPEYEFLEPRRKQFVVRVSVVGKSAEGIGASKKSATIAAAEALLKKLSDK
ncbi:MAG: ribonuclease III [Rickettsiales bacterium]|jgi:ribonuclease-3|nr:ribonuclease III [Rickettsiales bacterium]